MAIGHHSVLQQKVKRLVSQPGIHKSWETTFRTTNVERLWEQIYDDFVARIGQPRGSRALDIGCGPGFNAIRLACRGYRVAAVDYSEVVLPAARQRIADEHLADVITVGREDILNLSFPIASFDLVLCQGVLMHVPDLSQAVAEVARVVRPGGFIVLEELNQGSPESRTMKTAWSLFKRKITVTRMPAGHECSCDFDGETVFWRLTNAKWLTAQFAEHSCELFRRDSSMFTEFWKYAPGGLLKGAAHRWNLICARQFNLPRLAYHNLFIFRKREQSTFKTNDGRETLRRATDPALPVHAAIPSAETIEETIADGPIIAWVSDVSVIGPCGSRESRIVTVSGPAMSTRSRGTAARQGITHPG